MGGSDIWLFPASARERNLLLSSAWWPAPVTWPHANCRGGWGAGKPVDYSADTFPACLTGLHLDRGEERTDFFPTWDPPEAPLGSYEGAVDHNRIECELCRPASPFLAAGTRTFALDSRSSLSSSAHGNTSMFSKQVLLFEGMLDSESHGILFHDRNESAFLSVEKEHVAMVSGPNPAAELSIQVTSTGPLAAENKMRWRFWLTWNVRGWVLLSSHSSRWGSLKPSKLCFLCKFFSYAAKAHL